MIADSKLQNKNQNLEATKCNLEEMVNGIKADNAKIQEQNSELESQVEHLSNTIMNLEQSFPEVSF